MNNPRKKAFTLVELLVVIAILAILATTSVVGYTAFITKANISADEQEIAQLNGYLTLIGKVEDATQLEQIVDQAFGEGKFSTLEPRSAQHGYHYWYDVQNNQVLLKTYQEIQSLNSTRMRKNAMGGGTSSSSVALLASQNAFANGNLRMFGNYYVMDANGIVVGAINSLNAFDSVQSVQQAVATLSNVKSTHKDSDFAQAVLQKVAKVAFVASDVTFVFNADQVETFRFADGISTISSNVVHNGASKNYVALASKVNSLSIPGSVQTVQENALVFDQAGVVRIHTQLANIQEISGVFHANSTNGIIVDNTNVEYTIDGGAISGGNQSANLGYTNPVESFDIVTPTDTDDYKTVVGTLYVAYNYTGVIQLSASNFTSTTGNPVSSTEVEWSCQHPNVQIGADGKLSIVGIPTLENCTATITATAVAGGKTQTLTVYVVRPNNATFQVGNVSLDMAIDPDIPVETVNYSYNGTNVEIIFDPSVTLNTSGIVSCQADVVVTAGEGNLFTITNNVLVLNTNLQQVAGQQQFTVTVGTALSKTFNLVVTDNSSKPFEVKSPFNAPFFLYRVGNQNGVDLRLLFNSTKAPASTALSIFDVSNQDPIGSDQQFTAKLFVNGTAKEAWEITYSEWSDPNTSIEIQFDGTGVATITLGDASFTVEVVEGKNVTDYSQFQMGTNLVMLSNIYISKGSKFSVSNATLYGNNFVFDVSEGNHSTDSSSRYSDNYVIYLENGILDNVRIEGKAFKGFSATVSGADNICNVLSKGNNKIINSYISYCAAPVRLMGGQLEIIGTTLRGGSIANLDIREGTVILDNVTTINQRTLNSTLQSEEAVGLGIMVWYEGVTNVDIVIKNSLTQFNTMSKEDFLAIPIKYDNISLTSYFSEEIFNKNNGTGQFIYEKDGKQWINTGIFAMTDAVTSDHLKPGDSFPNKEDYNLQTVSTTVHIPLLGDKTFSGWLYSINAQSVVNTEKDYHRNYVYNYASQGQGTIFPSYNVDLGDDLQNKTDGSNEYCFRDVDGKILISFDEGGYKDLSIGSLCTATKGSCILTLKEINIYKDGVPIPNDTTAIPQSIKFDSTGEYVLEYVFEDKFNYNTNGLSIIKEHKKEVVVSVVEVEPETKNAEFYFFEDESYAGKTVTIGNTTYLTLDIDEATDVASTNGIQYMTLNDGKRVYKATISGITIYYPVIDMVMSDGKTSHTSGWYAYFYVFNGVVEIVDYNTSGEAITYNKSQTTMPSGLTVEDPAKTFKYGSATSAGTTPSVKKNYLCYSSAKIEANRSEQSATAMYTYKDNAGSSYSYYVGYYAPAQSYTNGCVTPDTLVTLADGTQKQIQHVTYQDKLLAWNFFEGKYEAVSSAIIFDHGYANNTVIKLNFSDGTCVKAVNLHQFFSADENKFVTISASNVGNYVGQKFVKQQGDGYTTVTLTSFEVYQEYIESYGIISAQHYNILVEGMFSTDFMAEDYGLFNYFEVGSNMMFDQVQLQADIDKYGLYTYEDFEQHLTYEQFVAFNAQCFKVAVGKGNYTYEGILQLIEEYLKG